MFFLPSRGVWQLIVIALILGFSDLSKAIDFTKNSLLASYEPNEVNNMIVSSNPSFSPNLTCTWPVRGGVNDVPPATEGDYVLKLDWTDDHKIEVKHIWQNTVYDLKDINYIIADVYFATESALPALDNNNISIWSTWDSNDYWIKCESVPPRIDEWYTVAFYVGNRDESDINNIDALTFENMPGPSGTIYVDNLRLQTEMEWPYLRRKVNFRGYWWSILHSDWRMGAGPNYYSDEPNHVFVDSNGFFHLSIINQAGNWYCTELIANENLGEGTYAVTLQSHIDLDPHHILGFFIYDLPAENGRPKEFDVELSKWGKTSNDKLGQFVCQPWYHRGNRSRFDIDTNDIITCQFTWSQSGFYCLSYRNDFPLDDANNIIKEWCYTGTDIFQTGFENFRINFYLMDGQAPLNGRNNEIIVKDFKYLPACELALPVVLSQPNGGERFAWAAREDIRWCTGCCTDSNVILEYWLDDGNGWREIAETENTGAYDWVVPDFDDANSHKSLIRIRKVEETGAWDTIDDAFSISACGTSIIGDEDGDCFVNFLDFAMLAENWLTCENPFDWNCN